MKCKKVFIFLYSLVLISCGTAKYPYQLTGGNFNNTLGELYGGTVVTTTTTTTTTTTIKTTTTTTVAASPSFAMMAVPTSGVSFYFNDTKSVTLTPFKMSNTEVPYSLWYTVRQWAMSNGYTFANVGSEGLDAYGGGYGTYPTDGNYEPVTAISWRDCIVWCNAYSDKSGLTPVYYTDSGYAIPLRTSTNNSSVDITAGSEDNPYVNWSANGYRLPTEAEWEYAARYKDGTNWTPYNYASGATADYNDATATGEVA